MGWAHWAERHPGVWKSLVGWRASRPSVTVGNADGLGPGGQQVSYPKACGPQSCQYTWGAFFILALQEEKA